MERDNEIVGPVVSPAGITFSWKFISRVIVAAITIGGTTGAIVARVGEREVPIVTEGRDAPAARVEIMKQVGEINDRMRIQGEALTVLPGLCRNIEKLTESVSEHRGRIIRLETINERRESVP